MSGLYHLKSKDNLLSTLSNLKTMTPKDVAEALKVSEETLRKWRSVDKGPGFIKEGATIRYPESEFFKFIKVDSDPKVYLLIDTYNNKVLESHDNILSAKESVESILYHSDHECLPALAIAEISSVSGYHNDPSCAIRRREVSRFGEDISSGITNAITEKLFAFEGVDVELSGLAAICGQDEIIKAWIKPKNHVYAIGILSKNHYKILYLSKQIFLDQEFLERFIQKRAFCEDRFFE